MAGGADEGLLEALVEVFVAPGAGDAVYEREGGVDGRRVGGKDGEGGLGISVCLWWKGGGGVG